MTIDKDTLPTEDIIPITFVGGTGGNFLCHFIVSAKSNIQDNIQLSRYGNAHDNGLKDCFSPPYGLRFADGYKIDFILSAEPHEGSKKPYYTASHIVKMDLINNNFKRSIRIVYDLDDDDINEISIVFFAKYFIDSYNPSNPISMKPQNLSKVKKGITLWQPYFSKLENMPNILFISWKELYKGNIEELITKLSIFTEIDPNNFSRESLMHWRNKTQYCIDKFTKIL